MFNGKAWLAAHLPEAYGLTDDTWDTVCSLTLLWNLFEERCCNRNADIPAFEAVVHRIDAKAKLPKPLTDALAFWIKRYVFENATNEMFDGLKFRDNHRKSDVQAVLLDVTATPQRQLFALLVIVYRLRNNLFHGEKSLPTLNEQRENLDNACRVLASVMELNDRRGHLM